MKPMHQLCVSITEQENANLNAFCEDLGISKQDFIFQAIKAEMKKHGGNIKEASE